MAIKDQCENCRKRGTTECTDTIVYDGVSCSSYLKGINLEKSEDSKDDNVQTTHQTAPDESTEEFVYTSEYLKQNKILTILLVVLLVINMLTMNTFGLRALNEICSIGIIIIAGIIIYRYIKTHKQAADDKKAMDDESEKF